MKNFWMLYLSFFLLISACATIQKKPLSPGELDVLKGSWEGMRVSTRGGTTVHENAELEIYSNTVPIKGKLAIQFSYPEETKTYVFENGEIDPQGRLIIRLPDGIWLELSLFQEAGQFRLDGNFFAGKKTGKIIFLKK